MDSQGPECDIVNAAVLAGMASLVQRCLEHNSLETLLNWIDQLNQHAGWRSDAPSQSHTAQALFGWHARELTIDLAAKMQLPPNARRAVRERLAFHVMAHAANLSAAIRESRRTAREALLAFEAQLDQLENVHDIRSSATRFESSRFDPPDGLNDREWDLLQTGPLAAVLLLSAAACNGPRELWREFRQADNVVLGTSLETTTNDTVGAVFHAGIGRRRLLQMTDRYPSRRTLLDQLQSCLAIVEEKGPEAHQEYGNIVMSAANAAAWAGRERGLFGLRSELAAERRTLDDLHQMMH